MDNDATLSNPTLQSFAVKTPLIPARFVKIGTELNRRQATGELVSFRAVQLKVIYRGVPSKLDGFASTWYSYSRIWRPTHSLQPGEVRIEKVI